jgi:hypothetical protein
MNRSGSRGSDGRPRSLGTSRPPGRAALWWGTPCASRCGSRRRRARTSGPTRRRSGRHGTHRAAGRSGPMGEGPVGGGVVRVGHPEQLLCQPPVSRRPTAANAATVGPYQVWKESEHAEVEGSATGTFAAATAGRGSRCRAGRGHAARCPFHRRPDSLRRRHPLADDAEHVTEHAVRCPVRHADATARAAHLQHLAADRLLVRREHGADRRHHDVEGGIGERQRLSVLGLRPQLQAVRLGPTAGLVQQLRYVVRRQEEATRRAAGSEALPLPAATSSTASPGRTSKERQGSCGRRRTAGQPLCPRR